MSTELAARKLDLAARSVDLLTALANLSSTTGATLRIPLEIGQWLGREKLTQHELEDCMHRATGLVIANSNGDALFHEIIREVEAKPIGPVFLRQSGSLGRLMAQDPNLSWMISTVACLFQFHRDQRYVAHALTSFIIHADMSRRSEKYARSSIQTLTTAPEYIQTVPVVTKIVSSVWFNVINAGCDMVPLPPELMQLCPNGGHCLDGDNLSFVIYTLTFKCSNKTILRTNHLLRDLMLWLLFHYGGLLVITLGGRVIWESNFGDPARELEVSIKTQCTSGSQCNAESEPFHILQNIAGEFEHFFSGYSMGSFDSEPQPATRQPLYQIDMFHSRDSLIHNDSFQPIIRCTAQYLLKWLLQVPLVQQRDFSDLGFTAVPVSDSKDKNTLRVSNVLYKVPEMIHFEWGTIPSPPILFLENYGKRVSRRSHEEDPTQVVWGYFPFLKDFIKKFFPHCQCDACVWARAHQSELTTLKAGCLCQAALYKMLLLVAHGIADGFGVKDVSAVVDTSSIIDGVWSVLYELGASHKVTWDTWFSLAARVCLGCPSTQSPKDDSPAFGGTTIAVVQYGNLAAIAPWLDLSRDLELEGCFYLRIARGRVSVAVESGLGNRPGFHSVAGDFAIIETAGSEDTSEFYARNKILPVPVDREFKLDLDSSSVRYDTVLVSVDETFYRLLLRVKTKTHWRIVDPSDALNGIIRQSHTSPCVHDSQEESSHESVIKIYTFEDLLGRWPDILQVQSTDPADKDRERETGTLHMTHILRSRFDYNVALALSISSNAMTNKLEDCCLSCAIESAWKSVQQPLRVGEGGPGADRYLINAKIPPRGENTLSKRILWHSRD